MVVSAEAVVVVVCGSHAVNSSQLIICTKSGCLVRGGAEAVGLHGVFRGSLNSSCSPLGPSITQCPPPSARALQINVNSATYKSSHYHGKTLRRRAIKHGAGVDGGALRLNTRAGGAINLEAGRGGEFQDTPRVKFDYVYCCVPRFRSSLSVVSLLIF